MSCRYNMLLLLFTVYICCAQTMDRDNPWIALPKVWIRALRNNPWIVCSIHGSRKRGTRSMDLGQTIDAWTFVRSGGLWLQNHALTFVTEAPPAAMLYNLIAHSILANEHLYLRQQG